LSGGVGSFDAKQGRITYGKALEDNLALLLSAGTYSSDGSTLHFSEFDAPETNHGLVENDDEQADNVVAHAAWGDFSLLLAHTRREKGIPTAPWDTVFGDPRTRTWDDTTVAGLTYTRALSEQYSLQGRVAYGQYDYDGRYAYDYAEPGEDPYIVLNYDYWKGSWWEGEIQAIGRPLEHHTVIAGAEFRYNARQAQGNYDEEVYLDYSTHSRNWGLYLQEEFTPLDKLTFIAGVRHDEYDTFGGTTNPRLALIWHVLQETTLKLLYGKAFRAPNVYELYYHDGGYSQKAALELNPETIDTYEVVVEQRIDRQLYATVSGFFYQMDDLIDQYLDPADDLLVFKNLDQATAQGVEMALAGQWESGWRSRLSYSYVNSEDDATGETLVDSPKHLAKLHIIAPVIAETLFAGLEVLYDSKARTLAGDYADDYTLTNLTLTYVNRARALELAASIYNLFETGYAFPGFGEHLKDTIEQDGRTFRVKLTYRFQGAQIAGNGTA